MVLTTILPHTINMVGFVGIVLLLQTPAYANSSEAVAQEAKAIAVRIEGSTQGSGVIIQRQGNKYTVLTAWHVIREQLPGEELAIYTPDGMQHQLDQGSIRHVGDVDLAVLSFISAKNYAVAKIGDSSQASMGSIVYVAGFPLATPDVPTRLLRGLEGKVTANSQVPLPSGYQLLYSSGLQTTLPGMSGGPVLNEKGQLIGIHGKSETEERRTEQDGIFVKTGTSQAVPLEPWLNSLGLSRNYSPILIPEPSVSRGNEDSAESRIHDNSIQRARNSVQYLERSRWVADQECPWMEAKAVPTFTVKGKPASLAKFYYLPSSIKKTPYGLVVDYCDAPDPLPSEIVLVPSGYTSRYRFMVDCDGRSVMDYVANGKWGYLRLNHVSIPLQFWRGVYFSRICESVY